MTSSRLGQALQAHWPDRAADALAQTARAHLPLVQLPPAGHWNEFRSAALGVLTDWLGRPLDDAATPDALVWRYLAAFGPAGPPDAQVWSGLTGLASVFERLRPRLKVFRDGSGRELFDLPRAPRPPADVPAPVRFLPEWDNLLLSHADRSRVMAAAHKPRVFTTNGIVRSTVLVDGCVRATWSVEQSRTAAVLRVSVLGDRLSRADAAAVAEEGRAVLAFVASGLPGDVVFGG